MNTQRDRHKRWDRKAVKDFPVIVATVTPFSLRRSTVIGAAIPDGVPSKYWTEAMAQETGMGIREAPINYPAFDAYLSWLAKQGARAVLIAGTTGEASTLGIGEQKELIKHAMLEAPQSLEIIAGTGSNDTADAVDLVSAAMRASSAAVILKTPYYVMPEIHGMRLHFKRILDLGVPVLLYDVPERTGRALDMSFVIDLAKEYQNFLGVKVEGDILRYRLVRDNAPKDFSIFATDGNMLTGLNAGICNGVITVMGNVVYQQIAELVSASPDARGRIVEQLESLHEALSREVGPQGIKFALKALGALPEETAFRLPLTRVRHETSAAIRAALVELGLITHKKVAAV